MSLSDNRIVVCLDGVTHGYSARQCIFRQYFDENILNKPLTLRLRLTIPQAVLGSTANSENVKLCNGRRVELDLACSVLGFARVARTEVSAIRCTRHPVTTACTSEICRVVQSVPAAAHEVDA